MDDAEVWSAIDAERIRVADLLEQLTDKEWQQPSLCEGWTIRDVAGHLAMTQPGLGLGDIGEMLRLLVKYPGPMNRMIRNSARDKARLPVVRLIAEIRATVGSRRTNLGLSNREILIDMLVHGQDIALPIGRDLPMPAQTAAAAAAQVWSYKGKSKARVFHKIPWQGFHFTATDVDWSVGTGTQIRGPIAALLLLLTGRRVALDELSGEGAGTMRQLLQAA